MSYESGLQANQGREPSAHYQAVIDAAVEVAVFSKTHEWPKEGSPEFFEFAQKLDNLATGINRVFPRFNANIQRQRNTVAHGND